MYWQKRFERENPDAELEKIIMDIRKENKDFGYRRIYGELKKRGKTVPVGDYSAEVTIILESL